MKKVDNTHIIKILTEKIEKISGKKVILEENKELREALELPEKIESLLKKYIRKHGLQGIFRITRHSNLIALDYIDKRKINEKAFIDFLLVKDFKQLSNKNIKGKEYYQFKNKYNYYVLLEVGQNTKII